MKGSSNISQKPSCNPANKEPNTKGSTVTLTSESLRKTLQLHFREAKRVNTKQMWQDDRSLKNAQ